MKMFNPLKPINKPMFPTKIVGIWALVFIAILIYSMVWLAMGGVTMAYIDAIEESFSFDTQAERVVTLIKNVILWHPVIAIFGWIFWGFLRSMRKDQRYDLL